MACELIDLDTFIVAFSEHADGGGASFQLQITITLPDEQDVRLGPETYCILVDGGPTCYGGIACCSFDGSVVSFELTAHAAESLGVEREFAFDISAAGCDGHAIAAGLGRVFERASEPVKFVSVE